MHIQRQGRVGTQWEGGHCKPRRQASGDTQPALIFQNCKKQIYSIEATQSVIFHYGSPSQASTPHHLCEWNTLPFLDFELIHVIYFGPQNVSRPDVNRGLRDICVVWLALLCLC